ncbi:hypothetical protein EON82_10465 [bacterium]|nr:MAG: hypothetical protein EON82_10465 [bacterium]
MPVTDFECKIARGQIDRYLGGELLSPVALGGLEEHLAECAECKAIVSERRAALLGKLNGEMPTHAVVSMPKQEKKEENPFIAALRAKAEEVKSPAEPQPTESPKTKTSPRYAGASSEKPSKPVLTKPIMLAGLLGVVLVGMNAMSRANGGKGVMGAKATETFASESLASTSPKATPAPVELPKEEPKPVTPPAPVNTTLPDTGTKAATVTAPVEETNPTPSAEVTETKTPSTEKTVEAVAPLAPKPEAVRRTAVKPIIHRTVRAPRRKVTRGRKVATRKKSVRKAATAPRAGVRVYGLDGQPLN